MINSKNNVNIKPKKDRDLSHYSLDRIKKTKMAVYMKKMYFCNQKSRERMMYMSSAKPPPA